METLARAERRGLGRLASVDREGNLRAKARAEAIDMMLEDFDLEPERYRLEWISASEGPRFAQVMDEMVARVKEVGPNPYG